MQHAVIMAGGSGTRLWPLSRRLRPKQLLHLFPGGSLLQIARERLRPLFPPENTWVITSADYIKLVAAELPDVPRANLIGEPVGRDTANAIGLAANLIALRDRDATMAVFTADHLIEPVDTFAKTVAAGLAAADAHPAALVTFGVTPDSPHTGYGYIQRGDQIADGVFRVRAFKEKPDAATAALYLKSGEYVWNSGMFAWRAATILGELDRRLPDNAAALAKLAARWDKEAGSQSQWNAFADLKKISIDFAVMEHAREVLVVELPCRWIDVGSWNAIAATRAASAAGNVAIAANALFEQTTNSVIVSEDDHLVVTLGLDNVVVIHSADATLVCKRDDVEKIKDLVNPRKEQFGERYE